MLPIKHSESHSVMSDSVIPMDCTLPGSSVHGDSPCKNTGVGCHALLGIFPTQGSKPRSPALQEDSLPSEPPGKPKNTEVGSLSLLQENFPTKELNRGSPALQADSLPAELPRKPRNTEVGSLSLLQENFPTKELNWGSPALQTDSLPAELPRKPRNKVMEVDCG